jgi:HEAT repeat protein
MGRRFLNLALCLALPAIPLAIQSRELRENPHDPARLDPGSMRDCAYAGRSLGEWTKRLASPNPEERLSAAWALHHIGPGATAAVPALVRALDDKDAFVRSISASALGKIGPGAAEAVPAMVRALRRSSYFHRGMIGPSIADVGPAAVPALIDATKDRDDGVRYEAVRGLGRIGIGKDEVVRRLSELQSDGDMSVRVEAAFGLWRIARSRSAISVLARCLGGPNEFARMGAADHLGEIGPEASEAVSALIRALEDPSAAVRNRSAAALGKIGPAARDAVPVLVRSVVRTKPSPVSRSFVTKAIVKIGGPAVPELIRLLRDQDESARSFAAESLGMIGPAARKAVPALVPMIGDPRMVMRLVAAAAMWRIDRDERGIPILLEVLRVGDANDQLFAMTILAEVGPAGKDAVPSLIDILTQGDRSRRPQAAAETLGRIGAEAEAAVPALEAALKDPDGEIRTSAGLALWRIARLELALKALTGELRSPDQNDRFRAAMALGEIGPAAKSAVPALIDVLKNNPSSQAMIARALGQLGPDAKAAVPALIDIFENDSEFEKEDVAKALIAIDPKAAHIEGIR